MNQAKNAIRNMTGADDLAATALSLDVAESDIVEMSERMRGEYSLDAEITDGDGATMLDRLADDRLNQEELLSEYQEQSQVKREVSSALDSLNEKERYVIEQRVTADDPMTLQEIADTFSISRERVRQIEENALRKMKALLAPLVAVSAA